VGESANTILMLADLRLQAHSVSLSFVELLCEWICWLGYW